MRSFADWSVRRENQARLVLSNELNPVPAENSDESGALDALLSELVESISASGQLGYAHKMQSNVTRWAEKQSSLVKNYLQSEIRNLEDSLSSKVASAIYPLFIDTIRQKAVDDFCDTLRSHCDDDFNSAIVVKAPPELYGPLLDGLARRNVSATVEVESIDEISAHIAETKIETKMSSWVQELRGLLSK